MTDLKERVISISRQISELRDERARLTAELDEKIAKAEQKLEQLIGQNQQQQSARRRRRRANGKATIGDRIVRAFRREPGMDYGSLTHRIYGSDTPEKRSKLRANLYALQKAGRIRPIEGGEDGQWEAAD